MEADEIFETVSEDGSHAARDRGPSPAEGARRAPACDYRYDADLRCLFIRWRGDMGAEFQLEAWARIASDPAFRSHYGTLHDWRDAHFTPDFNYDFVAGKFKANAEIIEARRDPVYSAHVVVNRADFGVVRMVLQIMDGMDNARVTRRVFQDMADALEWLGLPAGHAPDFDGGGDGTGTVR